MGEKVEGSFLIIDDHAFVRDSMDMLLCSMGHRDIDHAGSISEALVFVQSGKMYDLIFLDLTLQDSSGMATLDRLLSTAPSLPIVLVTAEFAMCTILAAFERGVWGVIPKTSPAKLIRGAIKLVLSGGRYIPEQVLSQSGGAVIASQEVASRLQSSDTADFLKNSLTPRQVEVASLLVNGLSNKEIARMMGITPGTVKIHISSILDALQTDSRSKAISMLNNLLNRQSVQDGTTG